MDEKKLAEAITKRAEELVNNRIRLFKENAINAARSISGSYLDTNDLAACFLALSKQLTGENKGGGYPKKLWDLAEAEVRDTLFNAFDPLQKVLKSKGGMDEGGPA